MQLLMLDSISYNYPNNKEKILDHISLEINEGEKLGLLGDNGSGKSTLLHIAAGLMIPSSGVVTLAGEHCHDETTFIKARKKLGYLLQNSEDMLFCPTVLEDVAFGPYNNGSSSDEAKEIAWQTLQKLQIDHLANFNGNHLSGGEKKLAALACILAMNPILLFLDEPTNNLDQKAREKLIEILKQRNLSSLVISHDANFMENICNCYSSLENGKINNTRKRISNPLIQ